MVATSLVALSLAASPVRVAVLPFQNATNHPEYDVLRQGLADLLITDLAGAEPLVVVERERFGEVLSEVKLQQTKFFDQRTTVKVGHFLGATHAIVGSLMAVAPKVRLTARVVDVQRQTVLVTASAEGSPDDLFELEQQLVRQLVPPLRATCEGTRSGHASLSSLVTYAQGLDAADRGELDQAKSKLGEAVRQSPDFALAQTRYAQVLRRLHEAQKVRGAALSGSAQVLGAHLEALLGKPPLERALAARMGLANLALLELSHLLAAQKDQARFVPPSLRADEARLSARFVAHAAALVEELKAAHGQHVDPALSDEDQALSKQAFGLDVSTWDFATPTSVAIDLGNFLGSGWTPYRSDVPQFAVRPSPSQRSAAEFAAARGWFVRAAQELPFDAAPDERPALAARLANEHAEWLVLLGRREEAVAQWQGFLDAFPTAPEFPVFGQKIEAVMLLDDQSELDQRQLKACDGGLLERGAAVATRIWRAEGRAGLTAWSASLGRCGTQDPRFAQARWALPAAELQRVADCDGHELLRAHAFEAGVTLAGCQSAASSR